jgi:hypothetical protein
MGEKTRDISNGINWVNCDNRLEGCYSTTFFPVHSTNILT